MPVVPKKSVKTTPAVKPELERTVAELYPKSRADSFGLCREDFALILAEIVDKYAPDAGIAEAHTFCCALKIEELALARACAAGHNQAWEAFLVRYREKLFEIANYITKEGSAGRDLADSIYADLYGTSLRDGQRVSKLASYMGRGSLEGWLRTVMAQEHVNRFRRTRRLVSLDEESEEGAQFATPEQEEVAAADPRLEAATDEAIGALEAEDRFVLAAYFLDERTLAEIARTLGVHESTISRKLDKLAKSLRKQVLANLRGRGMSRRQAEEALEVDVRDLRVSLRERLVQENAPATFSDRRPKSTTKLEARVRDEAGSV
ncbi:MAG TPA: sigma-70 family RNA polymerase sigma factor [Terriglobales bacterium]